MSRFTNNLSGLRMERDQYSAPTPGFMATLAGGLRERNKDAITERNYQDKLGFEKREAAIRDAEEQRRVQAARTNDAERRRKAIELARQAVAAGDHGTAESILAEAGIEGSVQRGATLGELPTAKRNPFAGPAPVRTPGRRTHDEPEAPSDGPGSEWNDGDADTDDSPYAPPAQAQAPRPPRGTGLDAVGTNYQQDLEDQSGALQHRIAAQAITPGMMREPAPLPRDNATGLHALLKIKRPTGGTIDIDPYAQQNDARATAGRQAQAIRAPLPPELRAVVNPALGAHEEGLPNAANTALNALSAARAQDDRAEIAAAQRAAMEERARLDRETRERASIRMANRPRSAGGNNNAQGSGLATQDLKAVSAEERAILERDSLKKVATAYNTTRGAVDQLRSAVAAGDVTTPMVSIGQTLTPVLGALTQGDVATYITSNMPAMAGLINRVQKEIGLGNGTISRDLLKQFIAGYEKVALPWLEQRRAEEIGMAKGVASKHVMPVVRSRADIIAQNVDNMFGGTKPAADEKPTSDKKPVDTKVKDQARAKIMAAMPDGPQRKAMLAELDAR